MTKNDEKASAGSPRADDGVLAGGGAIYASVGDAESADAASVAESAGAMRGDAAKAASQLPDEELLYDLADLFKVFSDTTRIRILFALMESDLCVADIAEAVNVSQSAVSHQLRTLKQAHLVKCVRDGKQVVYSLSDDHVYTMLNQGLTHICE